MINDTTNSLRAMRADGKSGGTTIGDKSKSSFLGKLNGITRRALGDGKADSPRNTRKPKKVKGNGRKGLMRSNLAVSEQNYNLVTGISHEF